MAVAQKFLFDLSFDPPSPDEASQEAETPPPVTAPTVTPEEIEAARSAAFEEGRRAALAEAAATREAEVAATLASISARMAVLAAELAAVREGAERSAVELAMAVARKF